MSKKICFLTGTRADFGKQKSLMRTVEASPSFECHIVATGMHLLREHGYTYGEIRDQGFGHLHKFSNQAPFERMEMQLANTIRGLTKLLDRIRPDLLVVHGDRVEALGGATAGALRNIRVAHIEGGELSGSVDELLRHATSKMSHAHFVSNGTAAARLRQLGEDPATIFMIGSPEVDVMLSDNLPSLDAVRERYEIPFDEYAIALYHPVTTEARRQRTYATAFVDALDASGDRFVVIHPNNDRGTEKILTAYGKLRNDPRFRLLPSMRFEYYLTLMRNARYVIGNSSSGVRECPQYGVPSVNIGTRQNNRSRHATIFDVRSDAAAILAGIAQAKALTHREPSQTFGDGKSAKRFMDTILSARFWRIPLQKQFIDLPAGSPPQAPGLRRYPHPRTATRASDMQKFAQGTTSAARATRGNGQGKARR